MKQAAWLGLLVLAMISLNACKVDCSDEGKTNSFACSGGTGTGNPAQPSNGSNEGPGSYRLMVAACLKLEACHPELTYYQCQIDFLKRTDIDEEVGIPQGTFSSYQETITGEISGAIRSQESSVLACTDEIRKLSCESEEVIGAYLPNASDPLAGLGALFAPICSSALEVVSEPAP